MIEPLIAYLSCSSPLSILHLGSTCWHLHHLITTSPSFRDFWFLLLHRTCHKSLISVAIRDCYPDCPESIHSWLMGVRHEIRDQYGECQVEHHQCRRCKPCLFTTRAVYNEWRRLASNRFLPKLWNHRKERKLKQLQQQLSTLTSEKRYFEQVNERFGLLSNLLKNNCSE